MKQETTGLKPSLRTNGSVQRRLMTVSAKQSMVSTRDCFLALLIAMTENAT
jgi:hypothetical protein